MATRTQMAALRRAAERLDAVIAAAQTSTGDSRVGRGILLMRQTCQEVIKKDAMTAFLPLLKDIRNSIKPFVPNP